jgi:IMP dehydrogenase
LCFDDVLIVPKYSNIPSRVEIDTSVVTPHFDLKMPTVASPMDTIAGEEFLVVTARNGGMGIIHRYQSAMDARDEFVRISNQLTIQQRNRIGVAVASGGDFIDRAKLLYDVGCRLFCVDVAHGHHTMTRYALEVLRNTFGTSIHIMAGNVATLEGFNDVADWGADSIRVGIGGGSICTTRIQTGHGMPTFQSVWECAKSDRSALLIADGGIRSTGDALKALGAGADMVMMGSMFAGVDEAPGEKRQDKNGRWVKTYRGMASRDAQMAWRGFVRSEEGVTATALCKGPLKEIMDDIHIKIQTGFSYSGARSLSEYHVNVEFQRQTPTARDEAIAHQLRG